MTAFDVIRPLPVSEGADKQTVRRQVKQAVALRTSQQLAEASERILAVVETFPEFVRARTVLLYWSMSREVDTRCWVDRWAVRKRILLPVMAGERLLLKRYTGRETLVQHPWGVWEPTDGPAVDPREVELAIIPGAAFDPQGGRLGYGKGFYDRLLASDRGFGGLKVGICFDFQLYERVPRDLHDVSMDRVVAGSPRGTCLYNPEPKD